MKRMTDYVLHLFELEEAMRTSEEVRPLSIYIPKLNLEFQRAKPEADRPYWALAYTKVFHNPSINSAGLIDFLLVNEIDVPCYGVEVQLGWPGGLITTYTDNHGQARFFLWHLYDPFTENAPCWARVLGISDEVHGVGIPIGYQAKYKLFYVFMNSHFE